MITGKEIFLD